MVSISQLDDYKLKHNFANWHSSNVEEESYKSLYYCSHRMGLPFSGNSGKYLFCFLQ